LALCRSISAIDFSSSSVAPIVRATLRAVSAEAAAAILVRLVVSCAPARIASDWANSESEAPLRSPKSGPIRCSKPPIAASIFWWRAAFALAKAS